VDASRFTAAAVVVAVVAPLLALVAAVALGPTVAFQGSIALSALVTLVFAVHNLQSVRTTGSTSFASGTVTALLGVWLAVAPVVYDAGFLPTAITQFAGLLTATFSAHAALSVVGRALGDASTREGRGGDPPAELMEQLEDE
jgi:predicted ABC-type exoprotein transport system permease subunit